MAVGVSRGRKKDRSSSRPDYVVIGLSLLSQVHRKALQLLNGLFGHPHVVLCFPWGAALQGINATFRQVHTTTAWIDEHKILDMHNIY